MRRLIAIPVSIASKRLTRKALLEAAGKPLFVHTYNAARRSKLADEIVVATEDAEVIDYCGMHRIPVFINGVPHKNGTARCHEAAQQIGAKYVINLQVDEPFIRGKDLDRIFRELESFNLVTAVYETGNKNEIADQNNVKVVIDSEMMSVYFSRAAIPHGAKSCLIHAGVYGYNFQLLNKYVSLKPAYLEVAESLEQLRYISGGFQFKVIKIAPVLGVNTRSDWLKFKRIVEKNF